MKTTRFHGRAKDSTQISFSLPRELCERVDAYAVKAKRNRSNALVYLVSEALDQEEKRQLLSVCPASGRGSKSAKAS